MNRFYKIRIFNYCTSSILSIIVWFVIFTYFKNDKNFEYIFQLCWIVIALCWIKDFIDFKNNAKYKRKMNNLNNDIEIDLLIEHFPIIFSILIIAVYRLIVNISDFIIKIQNALYIGFLYRNEFLLDMQFIWLYILMILYSSIDAYIDFCQDFFRNR